MDLAFEIGKEFALIAVAIWIIVFAVYKLPIPEEKFPKELMAVVIGIITAIVGWLSGLYTGHPMIIVATAVIAIFVSQTAYDKIKVVFKRLRE